MNKTTALPSPNQSSEPVLYGYTPEPPDLPAVPLSHYLWLLRRHRWKVLAFIALCVTAALAISTRLTRIYESTVTVDIDRQMPSVVVGENATPILTNDADQFLATQVKLIQSDGVLRPVAQQYHLLDLKNGGPDGTPETAVAAAPILLKNLKVTRSPNTYLLLISYRSPEPHVAADVANDIARSYVERTYDIRIRSSASLASFMEKQLDELKAKMERSSTAVTQFERELNVVNPEEKTSILSARLLQLNTEFTNAQIDSVRKESAWKSVQGGSLESAQVSTQGENLKALSGKLDEARQRFAEVKSYYGDNHPEYQKAAAQIEAIESELREARKNAAVRVEVEYLEAAGREKMLGQAVATTKEEFDRLNARSFDYQAIRREADADKTLYEELIRKIKEAGINAGFQNSATRIADLARVAVKPVYPIMWLNVILAFLFSSLLAFGAVVISDRFDKSIRDPEQVATLLKLDVMGTLPFVTSWRRRLKSARPTDGSRLALVLPDESAPVAREKTVTGFEENIRALRNSILLSTFDRPLKSLMITSATPAEGKTTTAVYLAIAHAQLRHKTLLIDCNLRRPGVHGKLGIDPETGLASLVQKDMPWRDKLVRLADFPDLDILPTGRSAKTSAPRRSDLTTAPLDILPCRRGADVIGSFLPKFLEEAGREYDLIIVDSPPILGLPEPLQMAAAVDGVILVVKAGGTDRTAVRSALTTLQRVRANMVGVVLNELTRETSDSHQHYGYYEDYKDYRRSA
jgi:succinoglycan biosynthesis transport protein ExoP